MKLAAVVVGVFLAASVAWFASEQHYENCLTTARANFPLGQAGLTAQDRKDEPDWSDVYADEGLGDLGNSRQELEEKRAAIRDRPRQRRQAAIKGCSRLPWSG